jgi:sugar lactone lactonase YvrE
VRTAAVDSEGYLWVVLTIPYVYVYDTNGEKVRTVRLRGAGMIAPTSLSFADRDTLLVTPGCYEFTIR